MYSIGNHKIRDTFGVEVWGDLRRLPWWRFSAGLNRLRQEFQLKVCAVKLLSNQTVRNHSGYEASLRPSMDLMVDFGVRRMDRLIDSPLANDWQTNADWGRPATETGGVTLSAFALPGRRLLVTPPVPEQADALLRSCSLGVCWGY
jgi:hypothetical protein